MSRTVDAFLLSAEWRDARDHLELTLWASSPEHGVVRAVITTSEPVMFVPRTTETSAGRRVPRELKVKLKSGAETAVDAVYFKTQRALVDERQRLKARGALTLESDLKPTNRFLMERFIKGGVRFVGRATQQGPVLHFRDPVVSACECSPQLRVLSLDIETDGWDGPVLSLALVGEGLERCILVRDGDERAALDEAFALIRQFDPDALIGWNVVDFDVRVLEVRAQALGLPFAIGREGGLARVLLSDDSPSIARVPGRVVLDGVATLKNASWAFERYTLEYVAQSVLGRGKTIRRDTGLSAVDEIRRMAREAPDALAAYNLEDARLVRDVFREGRLLEFLFARSRLTGLLLDRQGGSVAAFDFLYLPRLHRRGVVAHDVGTDVPVTSPGGHVLDSVPGLMPNVASFDFRSLYPSIVRTFQVDPLGLWWPGEDPVEGYEGATFARAGGILPELISMLHDERTKARVAGDETLSTAIKILMNSFYGVLGTPGSRYFDPKLASSITRRGHDIIERSKRFFEAQGHAVIYGDTDSLFVKLPAHFDEATARERSVELARQANAYWTGTVRHEHRLESHLELRFDTLFTQFLMPSLRGDERGSKKKYAGWVREADGTMALVVKGLEAVRTDWTPLAREAQRELLTRVFTGHPWEGWLLELRSRVLSGKCDALLAYRKRLRRELDAYDASAPHVKAARLLAGDSGETLTEVEYVMTVRGAQPLGHVSAALDYAHYLDRQLAPALDVVLTQLGTSWARIAGSQLELFE